MNEEKRDKMTQNNQCNNCNSKMVPFEAKFYNIMYEKDDASLKETVVTSNLTCVTLKSAGL